MDLNTARIIVLVCYVVTFFAACYILARARKLINYWPLIKVLAALIVGVLGHALATYFLTFRWPWLAHDLWQPVGRAIFAMCVSVWGAYLVWRINRLPAGYVTDLAGQAMPEDAEAAIRHLQAAAELLKRGVIDRGHWRRTMRHELGGERTDDD